MHPYIVVIIVDYFKRVTEMTTDKLVAVYGIVTVVKTRQQNNFNQLNIMQLSNNHSLMKY